MTSFWVVRDEDGQVRMATILRPSRRAVEEQIGARWEDLKDQGWAVTPETWTKLLDPMLRMHNAKEGKQL